MDHNKEKKLFKQVHELTTKLYRIQRSLTDVYSNLLDIEEQISTSVECNKKLQYKSPKKRPASLKIQTVGS